MNLQQPDADFENLLNYLNLNYRELTLEAIERRGKTIDCRVICTPLKMNKQQHGIILLMEVREESN